MKRKTKIKRAIIMGLAFPALFTSVFLYTPFSVYADEPSEEKEEKYLDVNILLPEEIFMLSDAYAFNSDVNAGLSVDAKGYVLGKVSLEIYDDKDTCIDSPVLFEQEVKTKHEEHHHEKDDDAHDGDDSGHGGDETGNDNGNDAGDNDGGNNEGGNDEGGSGGTGGNDESGSSADDNDETVSGTNDGKDNAGNDAEEINESNEEDNSDDVADNSDNENEIDNKENLDGENGNSETGNGNNETNNENNNGNNETNPAREDTEKHDENKQPYETEYELDYDDVFIMEDDGLLKIKANVLYYEIKEYKVGFFWKKTKYKYIEKNEEIEKNILIDKTAPKIYIKFDDENNGYYFNHSRKAIIDISDPHLDMESVSTDINAEVTDIEEGLCKKELFFGPDGYYSGKIRAKDIFGNESVYELSQFCIDTSAPSINVNISESDKKYTSNKRTAMIEILDEHLVGESKSEYVFREGKDGFEITASDTAGNTSYYKSEYFYQDYTYPTVEINGVSEGNIFNDEIDVNIKGKDSHFDPDASKVSLESSINKEEIQYSFDDKGDAYIKDTNGLKDDYYVLNWSVTDKALNTNKGEILFTINRNGSSFSLGDTLRNILGEYSETVSDININERNLSRIDPEDVRILFTYNAKIFNLSLGQDYTIEETKDESGFSYSYRFNDDLFEKEGVYTISVANVDEAGNNNDTRFFDGTDEIRFGVKKEKVLEIFKEGSDEIPEDEIITETDLINSILANNDPTPEKMKKDDEPELLQDDAPDITGKRLKDLEDKHSLKAQSEKESNEENPTPKKRKALYTVFVSAAAFLAEGLIRLLKAKKIIAK